MRKTTKSHGFVIVENELDVGRIEINFPELDSVHDDMWNGIILPSIMHVGLMLEALQAHVATDAEPIVIQESPDDVVR